jgi:hypothetical protein
MVVQLRPTSNPVSCWDCINSSSSSRVWLSFQRMLLHMQQLRHHVLQGWLTLLLLLLQSATRQLQPRGLLQHGKPMLQATPTRWQL